MKYRVLGRTGLKVSELGVGGHEYRRPLPTTLGRWGQIDMEKFMETQPERTRLIKRAIEAGVNYFDTTHLEEAKSLGLALRQLEPNGEIHISIMLLWPFSKMAEAPRSKWKEIIVAEVEEKLKLIQTDYADIATILMPERDYKKERLETTLEALHQFKSEGKIGFVGSSSHELRFLVELMRHFDCFDMVMIPYNYHQQEARDLFFPLARALEIGVVIIKPFAWPYYGIPFMRFGSVEGEEGSFTAAQTSLRWILRSPEIATIVAGMNNSAELEENLEAVAKEGEVDEELLDRYLARAKSPRGKKMLKEMLNDEAIDIRYFAERALKDS